MPVREPDRAAGSGLRVRRGFLTTNPHESIRHTLIIQYNALLQHRSRRFASVPVLFAQAGLPDEVDVSDSDVCGAILRVANTTSAAITSPPIRKGAVEPMI